MTLKTEKFEEMLSVELTRELAPQRGKALAAFRAELAAEKLAAEQAAAAPAVAGTIKRAEEGKKGWLGGNKQVSRKEMWFWASVPSVAAACVAVMVTLQLAGPRQGGTGTEVARTTAGKAGGTIVVNAPQVREVNQLEVTQKSTGEVVMNNDKPMQPFREQTTRQTQWFDPVDKASYKVIEQPVEKVGYQEITPF
jgi:hypothetical protein